jgi:hypothetical protein
MSLIEKVFSAAKSGALRQPFTTAHLKEWIQQADIKKDDGTEYADASINAILSNSDFGNLPTTNRNKKALVSQTAEDGTKSYRFPALD